MADERNKEVFLGVADGFFKDRTFERSRGCWSCVHWNNEGLSKGKWAADRQVRLQQALDLALSHPEGENFQPVVNLKAMVNALDHGIALGVFGVCLPGKAEADFVHNAYLCDHWTGREGSSLATSGRPIDKLPEELKEDVGDGASTLEALGLEPKDR